MVAADLAVQRADQEPVQAQTGRSGGSACSAHRPQAPLQTTVEVGPEFRVRRARGAAGGRGRPAQLPPGGRRGARGTDGGGGAGPGAGRRHCRRRGPRRSRRGPDRAVAPSRCTTRMSPPARRQRTDPCGGHHHGRADAAREARALFTSREPELRPRDSCGPCGGARTGSPAPRGCACAAGSRAPCDDDGCSAGTSACSRALSDGVQGRSRRLFCQIARWSDGAGAKPRGSAGTAHPRAARPARAGSVHGHAAPVDTG